LKINTEIEIIIDILLYPECVTRVLRVARVEELAMLSDGAEMAAESPSVFEEEETGTRAGA
jgi:hypothetical protein